MQPSRRREASSRESTTRRSSSPFCRPPFHLKWAVKVSWAKHGRPRHQALRSSVAMCGSCEDRQDLRSVTHTRARAASWPRAGPGGHRCAPAPRATGREPGAPRGRAAWPPPSALPVTCAVRRSAGHGALGKCLPHERHSPGPTQALASISSPDKHTLTHRLTNYQIQSVRFNSTNINCCSIVLHSQRGRTSREMVKGKRS